MMTFPIYNYPEAESRYYDNSWVKDVNLGPSEEKRVKARRNRKRLNRAKKSRK